MNPCKVALLCVAVIAAVTCADARRHGSRGKNPVCLDANDHDTDHLDLTADMDSHEEIWTWENGRPTLYCWHGCCGDRRDPYCCGGHGDSWEGDWDKDWDDWKHGGHSSHGGGSSGSHERDGHHGHHRKALTIVAIVAGVLAVGMIVLVTCVCVLKKKVRAAHRIQNTRNTFTILPRQLVNGNEKKQPLPEGEKSGDNLPHGNPYIIQGVPPPAYGLSPDAPSPTPSVAAEYPPSYSTLSLHQAAQEQPGDGGVMHVKPAGGE